VIAVDVSGRPHSSRVLNAPGRDVVTLAPAGHYDFASGSSFAAAHVSGAIALLRARSPHVNAQRLFAVLDGTRSHLENDGDAINVCAALTAVQPQDDCTHSTRSLAVAAPDH
jgi:subtilisin family serine protease